MKNKQKHSSRRTPPDIDYGSCESTYTKLLVYLDVGNINFVTETLGIEPTEYQNNGDMFTNSLGFIREAKCSYWCLSTEGKVKSKDLRHHLDWLLELLKGKEPAFNRLQQDPNIEMNVSCVWWSACGHGGPTLWPEQMALLAKLNLECSFDIYFAGGEGSF